MNFDYKRLTKFELNLNDKNKTVRLYGGCALAAISVFTASIPLLLLGMIGIATGYSGWCPVCSAIGKNDNA